MALLKTVTKEDLIKYYNDGMTMKEIGDIYGCDRKNITYYFKKFGIEKRNHSEYMINRAEEKRGINITKEDIEKMISEGMLVSDICEHYGVSRSALYKRCIKFGLNFQNHKTQREKQSEFMKENNPVKAGTKRTRHVKSKMRKTKKRNYIRRLNRNDLTFYQYSKHARHIAYSYYKRNNLTVEGKTIDHIYSIKDGYDNHVPLLVISHPSNLRLVTASENRDKGSSSLVTLEQLYYKVGVQRLSDKE